MSGAHITIIGLSKQTYKGKQNRTIRGGVMVISMTWAWTCVTCL